MCQGVASKGFQPHDELGHSILDCEQSRASDCWRVSEAQPGQSWLAIFEQPDRLDKMIPAPDFFHVDGSREHLDLRKCACRWTSADFAPTLDYSRYQLRDGKPALAHASMVSLTTP
jgi:hypothetical protein